MLDHLYAGRIATEIKMNLNDRDASNDYKLYSVKEGISAETLAQGLRDGFGFSQRQISDEKLLEYLTGKIGEKINNEELTRPNDGSAPYLSVKFVQKVMQNTMADNHKILEKASHYAGCKDSNELGGKLLRTGADAAPWYAGFKVGEWGIKKLAPYALKCASGRFKPIIDVCSVAIEKIPKNAVTSWFSRNWAWVTGLGIGTATGGLQHDAEEIKKFNERAYDEIVNH